MIIQAAKMAWKAVWGSKIRSFLTMLGIIIGVFALVVLVSLVSGVTGSVTDTMSQLGGSYLTVSISDDKGNPIGLSDLDTLMDEGIGLAAPLAQTSVTGKVGRESDSVQVYGTTPAYLSINQLSVQYGTFLRESNVDNHNCVAVINQTMAEELLGSLDCIGETVTLNGIRFTVIGILAENEESLTSTFTSDMMVAYIPYTTAQRLVSNIPSTLDSFYLSAMGEDSSEAAERKLTVWLMERFEQDEEAFTVSDRSALEDAMGDVTGMLQLLLGGIAAISLIVGGVGIMNIMLVSVTERTCEIGIRKAIGASRWAIMLQFLIEALVLSMLGCLLGLLLSAAALAVISALVDDVEFAVNVGAAWVAIGFSLGIGLIFGLYPANKAAQKQPIQALHYGG